MPVPLDLILTPTRSFLYGNARPPTQKPGIISSTNVWLSKSSGRPGSNLAVEYPLRTRGLRLLGRLLERYDLRQNAAIGNSRVVGQQQYLADDLAADWLAAIFKW